MPIQRTYRNVGEGSVVTYNYNDIANGTGTIIFYGFSHKETTTEAYALTNQSSVYSENITIDLSTTSDSFTKEGDLDFDLTAFNTPMTVAKGTMIASGTVLAGHVSSYTADIYLVVRLKRVRGGVETEISNAQSGTWESQAKAYVTFKTLNTELDISENAEFLIGDVLRVTVEFWTKRTTGTNCPAYFCFDPANRATDVTHQTADDSADTTRLQFHIPFRLDL